MYERIEMLIEETYVCQCLCKVEFVWFVRQIFLIIRQVVRDSFVTSFTVP
jgi:hypothetical protein